MTIIARTGGRFASFAPYVASINDGGVVAFQATLAEGGTGVYTSSGSDLQTIAESGRGVCGVITSHPDINARGDVCFYTREDSGVRWVVEVRGGKAERIADEAGPLGPTMNDGGVVAFRRQTDSGECGVFAGRVGQEGRCARIADNAGAFTSFHGLPVVNASGSVVLRAEERDGGAGIHVGDGNELVAVARTGREFSELGRFPILNDDGLVAFSGVSRGGGQGVFVASGGRIEQVLHARGRFESVRGVLINSRGRLVFFATERGGTLGVFCGEDPGRDCLIRIGGVMEGSTVEDFALNPVSMNEVGQIVLRVRLADQREMIVRADPPGG